LVGYTYVGQSTDAELWWGVVTATGAATITITNSGASGQNKLACQQFTAGTVTWSADTTTGITEGLATASGNYSSVTPASSGELYVGAAWLGGGAAGGGASGFVYATISTNLQFVYNLSAPSPSAPPWTQTSGTYVTVDGFLIATSSSSPSNSGFFGFMN
jgi:hypothetical protein